MLEPHEEESTKVAICDHCELHLARVGASRHRACISLSRPSDENYYPPASPHGVFNAGDCAVAIAIAMAMANFCSLSGAKT